MFPAGASKLFRQLFAQFSDVKESAVKTLQISVNSCLQTICFERFEKDRKVRLGCGTKAKGHKAIVRQRGSFMDTVGLTSCSYVSLPHSSRCEWFDFRSLWWYWVLLFKRASFWKGCWMSFEQVLRGPFESVSGAKQLSCSKKLLSKV